MTTLPVVEILNQTEWLAPPNRVPPQGARVRVAFNLSSYPSYEEEGGCPSTNGSSIAFSFDVVSPGWFAVYLLDKLARPLPADSALVSAQVLLLDGQCRILTQGAGPSPWNSFKSPSLGKKYVSTYSALDPGSYVLLVLGTVNAYYEPLQLEVVFTANG
jgi:hypothetical protein